MSLREARIIWCQDQYRVFQVRGAHVFMGRRKGEIWHVYRFCRKGPRSRKLIRTASTVGPSASASEDVLKGYSVFTIEDLSRRVRVTEKTLPTGAKALILQPRGVRSWLVSLHGGPESWESREIRYGGLYRELLGRGVGVVVLNYSGSKTPVGEIDRSPWGRWGDSITADFSALLAARPMKDVSLFGVSFGAALALHLRQKFDVSRTIVSSPLLDLRHQTARAGADFREWFRSRFRERDLKDFRFARLTANGDVHALVTYEDEVLGGELFRKIKNDWNLHIRSGGHAPTRYREVKALRFLVLNALSGKKVTVTFNSRASA